MLEKMESLCIIHTKFLSEEFYFKHKRDSQCYYLLISQGKEMSFTKANLGKKMMMKHLKFSVEDLHDMDFYRESHTPY